ncbi:GOLPH3/VPS74 family protein [Pengzhenrongella sicca]|uniref:GPP34 family phosphoprotein n=1 Tax=Pengzhenrongella sicca TaxID=2819238 RepID=A0A8A4ZEG1_9MICO|nr:GPP34 family phosphoprotein [Pengzhenrongella sicca]QTE28088.1 GPP34 family phosphoprotein [Pengzhenrongella sicca]
MDYGYFDVSTAALIELALARRIAARPGSLGPRWGLKLHVVDPRATGDPVVDGALRTLLGRSRPRSATRNISSLAAATVDATVSALEARGIVQAVGRRGRRGAHLVVLDRDAQRRVTGQLNTALIRPETVSDPRVGALADIRRLSGLQSAQNDPSPDTFAGPWHPADVRETVDEIVHGLRLVAGGGT